MSGRDKEIEGLFKRSFEGFEVTPSGTQWNKIKSKLDGEDTTDKIFGEYFEIFEVSPSQRVWDNVAGHLDVESYKRKALWFQRVAAGLLLLITVSGIDIWKGTTEERAVNSHRLGLIPRSSTSDTFRRYLGSSAPRYFINEVQPDGVKAGKIFFQAVSPASCPIKEESEETNIVVSSHPVADKSDEITSNSVAKQPSSPGPLVPDKTDNNSQAIFSLDMPVDNEGNIPLNFHRNEAVSAEVSVVIDKPGFKNDTIAPVDNSSSSGLSNASSWIVAENKEENKKTEPSELNYVRPSRWIMGITGSPDYTFRKLAEKEVVSSQDPPSSQLPPTSSVKKNIDKLNRDERGKYTCTAGLKVGYEITDKWQINAGLQYSTKGFITNTYKIDSSVTPILFPAGGTKFTNNSTYTWASVSANVSGDSIGESKAGYTIFRYDYSLNQKIEYVEAPLTVRYTLKSWSKFSLNLSGGMSVNCLVRARVYTHFYNPDRDFVAEPSTVYRRFYYSGIAGISAEYKVSKHIRFESGIIYRRAITPMNKRSPVQILPYSIGLNTGVVFHF